MELSIEDRALLARAERMPMDAWLRLPKATRERVVNLYSTVPTHCETAAPLNTPVAPKRKRRAKDKGEI